MSKAEREAASRPTNQSSSRAARQSSRRLRPDAKTGAAVEAQAVCFAFANEWKREQEQAKAGIRKISWSPGPHDQAVWQAAAKWQLQWQQSSVLWMESTHCAAYLDSFGYMTANLKHWRHAWVPLELSLIIVEGCLEPPHVEEAGCTWYSVNCYLGSVPCQSPQLLAWCAPRRLLQLRSGLHDSVKEMFGEAYIEHFADAPFARCGGPRGTTARLRKWLATLARLINTGEASPAITAFTLQFFQAPSPTRRTNQRININNRNIKNVRCELNALAALCTHGGA